MLDPAFDVFHHHDRVVDDNADREHQAEEREIVEAEAQGCHECEGADDRDGHRDQGDERGSPVLQKQHHNQRDEDDRVAERLEHLGLRLLDKGRGVVDDLREQPPGKPLAERCEFRPHGRRRADRVGPGQLVDVHPHARLPVEPADLVVLLGAELDPGDIAEPHDHACQIGRLGHGLLDDHIAKLGGRHQAADGRERNLEGLVVGGRLLADAAGGDLEVLVFKRRADVFGRQGHRGHLFRVQPDPHAVVPLSDEIDVADALHPQQLVADLNRRVVGKEGRVVERATSGVFGGGQVDDHHRGR